MDYVPIVKRLYSEDLMSQHLYRDVNSMYGTSYEKASIIVGEMQRQLEAHSNPVQLLRMISEILQDEMLGVQYSEIAAEIMSLTGNDLLLSNNRFLVCTH